MDKRFYCVSRYLPLHHVTLANAGAGCLYDFWELLASQAAVAMQNAQLYDDLAEEQRKLLEKEAQARHELAHNLPDGPTQALPTISMRLNFVRLLLQKNQNVPKSIDEVIKIEEIAAQTTKVVRNMLFALRPVVLETQGLVPAIEQYADRLKDSDNLNIKVNVGSYGGQLSTRQEGVLFAIIEEAVMLKNKPLRVKFSFRWVYIKGN